MTDRLDGAACAGRDPEQFFPHGDRVPYETGLICASCPIPEECLTTGVEGRHDGVWGGKLLAHGSIVSEWSGQPDPPPPGICRRCGGPVERGYRGRPPSYCSRQCRSAAQIERNGRALSTPCRVCGGPAAYDPKGSRHRLYCSKECQAEGEGARMREWWRERHSDEGRHATG
jgi:endogenous inhibitor of DNA gyrase (YacG/DUF329 family)